MGVNIGLEDNNKINASWLAKLMHTRGRCVMEFCPRRDMHLATYRGKACVYDEGTLKDRGVGYGDIQEGDLVFFRESALDMDYGVTVPLFEGISHVAVVSKAESFLVANNSPHFYYHEITEIVSNMYAYYHDGTMYEEDGINFVKDFKCSVAQTRPLWEKPSGDANLAWGATLVMVCRPNLQAASLSDNLSMEAQNMGLHSTPKDWNILNVVKRARQFTDVKWTPAVDLQRKSPFADAIYQQGVEYTGLPAILTDGVASTDDFKIVGRGYGIESFASGNSVAGTYNTTYKLDGTHNSICSGWLEPMDLVRYAFDLPSEMTTVDIFDFFDGGTIYSAMEDMEIGDVYYLEEEDQCIYVGIITDIVRNSESYVGDREEGTDDDLTMIEVCEARFDSPYRVVSSKKNGQDGGGLATRRMMTSLEFIAQSFVWDLNVLKPPKTHKYQVSAVDIKPQQELPLIPFYGNKTYYRESGPSTGTIQVPLIINDTGYTHIRVERYGLNSTPMSTKTYEISQLSVIPGGVLLEYDTNDSSDEIDFLHQCRAYLVDDNDLVSVPCEWRDVHYIEFLHEDPEDTVPFYGLVYPITGTNVLKLYAWTDEKLEFKTIQFTSSGVERTAFDGVIPDYWYICTVPDEGFYMSMDMSDFGMPTSGTVYFKDTEYGSDIPAYFSLS